MNPGGDRPVFESPGGDRVTGLFGQLGSLRCWVSGTACGFAWLFLWGSCGRCARECVVVVGVPSLCDCVV